MPDPAGSLEIQLRRSAEHASGWIVTIDSTRPVRAASVFAGRTPGETMERLPLLFSICARAQAGACAKAFEQALARRPSAEARARREAAIATETLREHLWRILLDWPLYLGDSPRREEMARVLSASNRILAHLDPAGELFQLGARMRSGVPPVVAPLRADLTERVTRLVFGMTPETWTEQVVDAATLAAWCRDGDTDAARLLRTLLERGEDGLGHAMVAALPGLPDAELIERLGHPDADAFIAMPTWSEVPRETSPFTRWLSAPLIESTVKVHGRGLLARLAAQLLEVATRLPLLSEESLTLSVESEAPEHEGIGLGRTQAARGLLVHLVRIESERVKDYRILAPTEWNFHPHGVVAQGLASLPSDADETALRRQAELLITAIDPCVGFELMIV